MANTARKGVDSLLPLRSFQGKGLPHQTSKKKTTTASSLQGIQIVSGDNDNPKVEHPVQENFLNQLVVETQQTTGENSPTEPQDSSENNSTPSAKPIEILPSLIPVHTALLALGLIEGVGHKSIQNLFHELNGDLGEVFRVSLEPLLELLYRCKIRNPDRVWQKIGQEKENLLNLSENQWVSLSRKGVKLLTGPGIPGRLRNIENPPKWLFVQGNSNLLDQYPAVAVVGTRQPTSGGIRATRFVAGALAPYPIVMVSGLAEGIDEEAHRTSLQEGVPNVAFLGHGLNIYFPSKTTELRKTIIEKKGAIATEYLPDETYQKHFFVERNRLQAGLADLVIPVEANIKSGTAHTVQFARKFNRKIVGIKWDDRDGTDTTSLAFELRRERHPIIDIRNESDRNDLDGVFRKLAEEFSHRTYAFKNVERRLRDEVRTRNTRHEDWKQLLTTVLEGYLQHQDNSGFEEIEKIVNDLKRKEDFR